jgi:voltage-gated potassium channel
MAPAALSKPRFLSRFRLPLALLVFTVLYGTLGYRFLEGWSWLDSGYMTMISLTTVGYREVEPLDASGQIFTISLLFFGVVTLLSAVGVGTELLASGELSAAMRRRRLHRQLGGLNDHAVICGFGRVGRAAAAELEREDVPYAVVDVAEELGIEDVPHVVGNATDEAALRAAGIERARSLLCAVDSDAVNVYVTITARALNEGLTIVARAAAPESVEVLRRAGADRVVSPFALSGRQMAFLSLRPSVVDFIDSVTLAPGLRLEEIVVEPDSWLAGRGVGEVAEKHAGLHVLAVRRAAGGDLVAPPGDDLVLDRGDLAVVFGPTAALESLT